MHRANTVTAREKVNADLNVKAERCGNSLKFGNDPISCDGSDQNVRAYADDMHNRIDQTIRCGRLYYEANHGERLPSLIDCFYAESLPSVFVVALLNTVDQFWTIAWSGLLWPG